MPHATRFIFPTRSCRILSCIAILAVASSLHAQTTISTPTTTAITLSNATPANNTLTVTGTGSIILPASSSTVAVTVTKSATITNLGTIQQNGTVTGSNAGKGRAIRDNTGSLTLTINNGSSTNSTALLQTADADVIQMNVAASTVTLNNYGTLNSQNVSAAGNQAIDWNALNTATGSNTLNNFATGIITANEADAVRPGMNGFVNNDGLIKSTTSTGSSSDGIDAQTLSGITVVNAASAGGGTGTGLIEGGRHGITGGNTSVDSNGIPNVNNGAYTMSVTNNLGGTIKGDNGSGINIDGLNANEVVTIANHGTITGNGVTGDGDGIDVDGLVNLNNSGTIKSFSSFNDTSEGVTVGGGTIVNSGTIQGSIDPAGGNTGTGRGITIAGIDKNPDTDAAIPVQAPYGPTTITNSGLIKGDSDSGIAFTSTLASGFTTTINNLAGGVIRGAGATAATIQTGADNDTINNAGSIINDGGDSKTAISLGAGDDQVNVTGGSAVITGGIDGGSGTNALTFNLGAANNAFTHSGVISNFSTVAVQSGKVTLNGNNTYAGTTTVGGGAFAASLRVNGRHSGGGAYTVLGGNTLGGTGTFALATPATKIDIQSGAALHIGGGQMTVETGSLNVDGQFIFDLNGPTAGTAGGYDQLLFSPGNTGALTLGSGSNLQLDLSFAPVIGQQFELFNLANSSTFINGTFAGLSEGATFTQGGQQFQISYLGGTGNDLVVTAIPEPSTTAALLGLFVFSGVVAYRVRNRETGGHLVAL